MMIRLVIAGIAGRMGNRLFELARKDTMLQVVYGLESPKVSAQMEGIRIGSDTSELKNADVIIDFTIAEATSALLPHVLSSKRAYVIGTTGFSPEQEQKISEAAKVIPIVKSANMSLGVNVFFKSAQNIARALP